MKPLGRLRLALRGALVAILAAVPVWADAPEDAEKEKLKRWDQQFQESLGWYEVTARPGDAPALKPQRVIRWTNPTRKQRGRWRPSPTGSGSCPF